MRGSPVAYEQLKQANQLNDDTLYFIYKEDALDGELYLGSKLIAGVESLTSLEDIEINLESLADKQVLTYDIGSGKWVNTTIEKAINKVFIGATSQSSGIAGLVPAPALGQTNLFLRSDGTWASINSSSGDTSPDNYATKDEVIAVNTKVEDLTAQLNNIQSKVQINSISINTIDTKVEDLVSQLNILNTITNKHITQIEDLTKILNNKVDLDVYNTKVTLIDSDLTALKSAMAWSKLS